MSRRGWSVAQEGEERARFPPHMDSALPPRLLDGPLPALKSTGGDGADERKEGWKEGRDGWMDGGEQTLEKHKAGEYEQIRITRTRPRGPCPEARATGQFLDTFSASSSSSLK